MRAAERREEEEKEEGLSKAKRAVNNANSAVNTEHSERDCARKRRT